MKKAKAMQEFNDSIGTLAKDLNKAIADYFKRGCVNFSSVIGVLEDMKIGLVYRAREVSVPERFHDKTDKAEYIG